MARAFVYGVEDAQQIGSELRLRLRVAYVGGDVPDNDRSPKRITVTVENADVGSNIRTKIHNEVISIASGFGATVVAGDIWIPSFSKG